MIVHQESILSNPFYDGVKIPHSIFDTLLKKKSSETYYHSLRVAQISYAIAKQMGFSSAKCELVYLGGLLHDIGKLFISDSILNKPTKLTNEEYQKIKEHSKIGYEMIKYFIDSGSNTILDIVLYHHERFDGNGYPYGLKGDEIPLTARIVTVADSFDAMSSRRVYQEIQTLSYISKEIRTNIEVQFDSDVVHALFNVLQKDHYFIA